ncbi:hypothetical protein ACLOJK_037229 [Asimina triloba]
MVTSKRQEEIIGWLRSAVGCSPSTMQVGGYSGQRAVQWIEEDGFMFNNVPGLDQIPAEKMVCQSLQMQWCLCPWSLYPTGPCDVLMGFEHLADVDDDDVGGGDHLHLGRLPVYYVEREAELSDHAEQNDTTSGLAVVQLPLDEERFDAAFSWSLGEAAFGRAPAHNGDTEVVTGELGAVLRDGDVEMSWGASVGSRERFGEWGSWVVRR